MNDESSLTRGWPVNRSVNRAAELGFVATEGSVAAAHAEPIALHRKLTAEQSFVVIGLSCLRHFTRNEPGVRAGNVGAVHQMRVGLRRLRAALSLFEGILGQHEVAGLKRELAWLTEQLGPARDYDVVLAALRRPERGSLAALDGRAELEAELTRRRAEAVIAAGAAASSERARALVIATAAWLVSRGTSCEERRRACGDQRAERFAREVLARRTKRVLKRVDDLARLDATGRHQLRIQTKKLRYGAEFFATSFPEATREQKRFVRVLERLQRSLGKLSDVTVHQRLAGEFNGDTEAGSTAGPAARLAMTALAAQKSDQVDALVVAAQKTGERLARTPGFWKTR
ncbi:MAG: CHAD domain-containing protein [Polyangiaceae bacterium]